MHLHKKTTYVAFGDITRPLGREFLVRMHTLVGKINDSDHNFLIIYVSILGEEISFWKFFPNTMS